MILLRLISWPNLRKHVLRTALTTAGIVLGVAVFLGINAANQSVLAAFSRTIDRIAGKTELQVTAGETGFPEEILEAVQSAPAVRIAVPAIEAVADTNRRGQGSLMVLGVDFTGDRTLRDYDLENGEAAVVDDPLVFLAQPDSIIVSNEFASRNQLTVGSRLPLETVEGERAFTVRGVMRSGGLSSAFGGNLAVMDIYAAQKMFGRGRSFDRIDVACVPDVPLAKCAEQLRRGLGPGFSVDPPSERGEQFASMIAAYSLMMSVSSVFALLIGMFIIYNSFAIAVTERRAEIGILRALGATRGQIQRLFLGESVLLGLLGSLAGLAAGALLARGIAVAAGTIVSDVYGLAQGSTDVTLSPALLAAALGVGVATSIGAALVPARTAARVDPVRALQKGKYQVLSAGENRARALIAVVFAIVSVVCLSLGRSRPLFYVSYVLSIGVALLLTPMLALLLARLLRPLLKRLRPVEGALAADSLIQAPRRTSASVAALMLSLAMVVAFAGMARASYNSILEWADTTLNPDLYVMPSPQISQRTARFPAAMEQELVSMPGIGHVQAVREARIMFRDTPVMLLAIPLVSLAETTRAAVVAGDPQEMYRVAAAGQGVILSENFTQLRHVSMGETIELPTPGGALRLPVVGIIVDYSDQQGTIIIDRQLFEERWRDDTINFFRVYLGPGARWDEVKARILERYAGKRQVFVLNNDELRQYILKITDQWFGLTYVQVTVAILVAILGIVNTLTVSIRDRRREFGVLRAVGGLRGQVKRTIWLEALSIAAIGIVLGFLVGAINLQYVLEIVRRDVAGMRLDYRFPYAMTLQVAPLMLAAAFLAAVWPAASAVQGSLIESLEDE